MNEKLVVKLGGDTSFDIYPKGWDKTYCLRFFQDCNVWFVGDRCSENGNDFEIYEAVNKNSQAYYTSGPRRTVDIINQIKIKILKSNYKRAPLPR
jgi:phosphomannomutase